MLDKEKEKKRDKGGREKKHTHLKQDGADNDKEVAHAVENGSQFRTHKYNGKGDRDTAAVSGIAKGGPTNKTLTPSNERKKRSRQHEGHEEVVKRQEGEGY